MASREDGAACGVSVGPHREHGRRREVDRLKGGTWRPTASDSDSNTYQGGTYGGASAPRDDEHRARKGPQWRSYDRRECSNRQGHYLPDIAKRVG
jgi:hypothetical protein